MQGGSLGSSVGTLIVASCVCSCPLRAWELPGYIDVTPAAAEDHLGVTPNHEIAQEG